MSHEELLPLAERAARAGAAVHARWRGQGLNVDTKSSPTDLVTQVDREAERAVVDVIRAARPQDAILAEEGTASGGESGWRWVIDPLDGTTNYVYGWPAYAVSIGVEYDGQPQVGVVHDTALGRVFAGAVGRGATLNGVPITVGQHAELSSALIATGFQATAAHRAQQGQVLARVLPQVRDVRRGGSAAIDIASVACGQLDGFFELGLAPWDLSGGVAIATAAGARVVVEAVANARGPMVVVAGPRLIEGLVGILRAAGAFAPLPA